MDCEQHLPPSLHPAASIDFSVLNYITEALFWIYIRKSREHFDLYEKGFLSTAFVRPLWRDLQDTVWVIAAEVNVCWFYFVFQVIGLKTQRHWDKNFSSTRHNSLCWKVHGLALSVYSSNWTSMFFSQPIHWQLCRNISVDSLFSRACQLLTGKCRLVGSLWVSTQFYAPTYWTLTYWVESYWFSVRNS